MVEVTKKTRNDIDRTLGRALTIWGELPEVAEEIEGWDEVERIDFVHEWPLQEMKLERLREYAREGTMNPRQNRRYRTLENLVEHNRPIIEELQQRYIG